MILLPTISDGAVGDYVQTVALDRQLYRLRLMWNARVDHWMLSLYLPDADETPLAQGRMVINGVDLLRGCTAAGRPPGRLVATPLDDTNEHAGLTGLGSRVGLYYFEEADLL